MVRTLPRTSLSEKRPFIGDRLAFGIYFERVDPQPLAVAELDVVTGFLDDFDDFIALNVIDANEGKTRGTGADRVALHYDLPLAVPCEVHSAHVKVGARASRHASICINREVSERCGTNFLAVDGSEFLLADRASKNQELYLFTGPCLCFPFKGDREHISVSILKKTSVS